MPLMMVINILEYNEDTMKFSQWKNVKKLVMGSIWGDQTWDLVNTLDRMFVKMK